MVSSNNPLTMDVPIPTHGKAEHKNEEGSYLALESGMAPTLLLIN